MKYTSILSQNARRRVFVGPPDPVSFIRPIRMEPLVDGVRSNEMIYNSNISVKKRKQLEALAHSLAGPDLEYRLGQQRMEVLSNTFWTESNMLFERQRSKFLKEAADQGIEPHLAESQFLAHWLNSRHEAYAKHSSQWWKTIWSSLYPSFKSFIRECKWRYACWRAGV